MMMASYLWNEGKSASTEEEMEESSDSLSSNALGEDLDICT